MKLSGRVLNADAIDWCSTPHTSIHSGTHPEYTRKSDALQRVRDRRVFAAERFKQMQMDNLQGLYEYEVLEAEASYKVRCIFASCVLRFAVGRSIVRSIGRFIGRLVVCSGEP